jgi:hypothetical protein
LAPTALDAARLTRTLSHDPLWIAPDWRIRAEQRGRAEKVLAPTDPEHGFYARELRAGLDHTLVSWEAEEQYNLGERFGIRFLHPFTDPDLVEMLYRTPPHILNEGGRTKGLVRQVLARRFPALKFERQRKVLSTSYFQSLIRHEGPVLAKRSADFPALSGLGVINGRAAHIAVREALNRPGPTIQRLWDLFNLETWAQSHGGH